MPEIKFHCTQEEYDQIIEQAHKSHKTTSAYLRKIAANHAIININYDAILEHSKVIQSLKSELHLLITMLVQTRQAYPADVQHIIKLLDDISDNQKKILQQTQRERQNIRKHVKKIFSDTMNPSF